MFLLLFFDKIKVHNYRFQPFYYAMSIVSKQKKKFSIYISSLLSSSSSESENEESSSSGLIVKMTGSRRISLANSFSMSSFCTFSACSTHFFQFSTVTFSIASCVNFSTSAILKVLFLVTTYLTLWPLLVPISIQSGYTGSGMKEDVPLHDLLCTPLRLIRKHVLFFY